MNEHWTQDAGEIRAKLADLTKYGVVKSTGREQFNRLASRLAKMTGASRHQIVSQAFEDGKQVS